MQRPRCGPRQTARFELGGGIRDCDPSRRTAAGEAGSNGATDGSSASEPLGSKDADAIEKQLDAIEKELDGVGHTQRLGLPGDRRQPEVAIAVRWQSFQRPEST